MRNSTLSLATGKPLRMVGGSRSPRTRSWTAMCPLTWHRRLTCALRPRAGLAMAKMRCSALFAPTEDPEGGEQLGHGRNHIRGRRRSRCGSAEREPDETQIWITVRGRLPAKVQWDG